MPARTDAPTARTRLATIVHGGRALTRGLALGLLATCTASAPTDRRVEPVVYGDDDRQDVYAHPSAELRALATQSIVALVPAAVMDERDPTNVVLNVQTVGQSEGLCTGERFANDPAAAYCSGTLIDDDLVVTAGHCFTAGPGCDATRAVFGYYRTGPGELHRIAADDVFRCRRVVALTAESRDGRVIDFAVFQLERHATPRFTAVTVRRDATPLATGTPLAVLGFGSGAPCKIDSGGTVRDPRANTVDFFLATTDTFHGNSGSGVFDLAARRLVGVLSRGETDYVDRNGCNVVNRCAADGCAGEAVTYAHRAADGLCAVTTGARFCGGNGELTLGHSGCAVAPARGPVTARGAAGSVALLAVAGARARRRRRRQQR